MPTRQQFIVEARGWIGTRFHHQGRLKRTPAHRGGCDCIGLIMGVADAVGMQYQGRSFSALDRTDYAKLPDGAMLKDMFCRYLQEIPVEDAQAGDVLMFRFDKAPQHVGILSAPLGADPHIIHCYMQARGVVEHRLDEEWCKKIVGAFVFEEFKHLSI